MARLCVALDLELKRALKLAEKLRNLPLIMKVGPSLMIEGGTDFVKALKDMGFEIFLDLKLHDIPNTVRSAVHSAEKIGADYVTVHTLGGKEMLMAARETVQKINLIGVTLLTSQDADYLQLLKTAYGTTLEFVLALANYAKEAHLDGVVCSAHEVRKIKEATGLLTVVPGLRLIAEGGDQKRVSDPAHALREGADILVVGREITGSPDPLGKVHEILGIIGS